MIKQSGIELTYVASETALAPPLKWWSTKASRRATVHEYVKLVGNTFGFHGSEAKLALKRLNRWLL